LLWSLIVLLLLWSLFVISLSDTNAFFAVNLLRTFFSLFDGGL